MKAAIYLNILIIAIIVGLFAFFKLQTNNNIVKQPIHVVNVSPTPTPVVMTKYFGVNISGPEFQDAMYADNTYTGYTYFHNKGLTLLRMPFKWERLQPTLQGKLNTAQVTSYKNMISSATKAGNMVIVEVHNYGRYNDKSLTSSDTQNFSDLWTKMVTSLKDSASGIFGYELMNEPHDMPGDCQTWKVLSQAAIDAIRQQDQTHYIIVPGYSWQGAADWQTQSDCLKDLVDPNNKLIYSAHEYFDEDKSGTYHSSCTDTSIGVERAQPFLTWLKANNKLGMFTEYGIPQDECWQQTLNKFMTTIATNKYILGGTYWAAGPYWGDYPLSVDPTDKKDTPQMNILEKYPTKQYNSY